MSEQNTQVGPYPAELAALVAECSYRPGWKIDMQDMVRDTDDIHSAQSSGLTLVITTLGYNSYHPEQGQTYGVHHYFAVPPSTFNRANWQRWLFDRFCDVETHECMEFFKIGGDRPFAPNHGPGESPYTVREYSTDAERRTSFRGVVKDE